MEAHWYRSSLDSVAILLLPFSWIFSRLVAFRRYLYRIGFKKTTFLSVPVIVVGNITVGGTGKTPFVLWLAEFLKENNFKPGIVSRGVGGQQKLAPRFVEKNSDPALVGDEAILLAKSGCPVVIGIDRVAAARELVAKKNCDVIISDDGLQHYRLGRAVEIAMIDGDRGLGNQQLLPAGPLREKPARLKEVDFVIEQVSEKRDSNYWPVWLEKNDLVAVSNSLQKKSLSDFKNQSVHAVAAIGNPDRFFNFLREQGLNVIPHVFPDHYLYQAADLNFSDSFPIIMTEKDAVKCEQFSDERFWYLPVKMKVQDEFATLLLETFLKKRSQYA